MLVLIGLWLEKEKKDWFRDIDALRRHRIWAEIGWWILMAGIAVEIVTAGVFAIKEEVKSEKTATVIENARPENQPITSVTAFAWLSVLGTNFWNIDPVKDHHFVTLSFAQRDPAKSYMAFRLVCKASESFGNPEERDWYLEFGPDPTSPLTNLRTNDTVKTADEWKMVLLQAKFLHSRTPILKGDVTVIVNSRVMHFPIPPQLANPMYGRSPTWDSISVSNVPGVMVQQGP
jgi:hypothetical protein